MMCAKNYAILLRNTEESGTHIHHRHIKCSKVIINIYIQLCFLDVLKLTEWQEMVMKDFVFIIK